MLDDVLKEIARRRDGEELLLPLRCFSGELRKYLRLGVFKRSAMFRESIPCPNGCGVLVRVLKRGDGDYIVCCGHGDRPMEDIKVPREDVELYALDWVTFGSCVSDGRIAFSRPSTPEERKADPVKAKEFLQDTAREIAEKTVKTRPAQIAEYILSDAGSGDMAFADCKEIRNLKRIHRWQDTSFRTYVRQAFANGSSEKTAKRRSKIESKRKRISKELSKL